MLHHRWLQDLLMRVRFHISGRLLRTSQATTCLGVSARKCFVVVNSATKRSIDSSSRPDVAAASYHKDHTFQANTVASCVEACTATAVAIEPNIFRALAEKRDIRTDVSLQASLKNSHLFFPALIYASFAGRTSCDSLDSVVVANTCKRM